MVPAVWRGVRCGGVAPMSKHKRCEKCGKGRQRCQQCEHYSLRGHKRNGGLCAYHWNVYVYGKAWADRFTDTAGWRS